jgi:hypothetical protein
MLKLKIGLLVGGAIGWAVGSGKAQQWWRSLRASMGDRPGGSTASWADEALGTTGTTRPPMTARDDAVRVTETMIASA